MFVNYTFDLYFPYLQFHVKYAYGLRDEKSGLDGTYHKVGPGPPPRSRTTAPFCRGKCFGYGKIINQLQN